MDTEQQADASALLSSRCRARWEAVEGRILAGIQRHRTQRLYVHTIDQQGRPLPGVRIGLKLRRHAFLFGANLFLVDYFSDPARHPRYARLFGGDRLARPGALFNAGTVALYWHDLEPEAGRPRYAAGSPWIARRPPSDLAVAFGREHALDLNGHCLVWDAPALSIPDWLPGDAGRRAGLLAAHIQELGARYGTCIRRWDVVNELVRRYTVGRFSEVPMPPDFGHLSFAWAQTALPADALLMINEGGDWGGPWEPAFAEEYRHLIRDLLSRDARLGGIGLQFHQFDLGAIAAGTSPIDPVAIWEQLERYAAFGLPLHISEVTMAQPSDDPGGALIQAELTRRFYRLFYAHPAVHGVTWWNTVDGTAWGPENHVKSGILDADCRAKPVHAALDGLINQAWAPVVQATSDAAGGWEGGLTSGEWVLSADLDGRTAAIPITVGPGGGAVAIVL